MPTTTSPARPQRRSADSDQTGNSSETTEAKVTRLNVNLNEETAAALRELASRRGISFTEAVRRAIGLYSFMDEEIREGHKVQSVTKSGATRELLLM